MSASRPGVLKVGMRVRLDGVTQTIVGLSGALVRLAALDGQPSVIQLAHLLASPGFEVIDRAGPPGAATLSCRDERGSPGCWRRRLCAGNRTSSRSSPASCRTRVRVPGQPGPAMTPQVYSLAQREQAKAAELAGKG